MFWHQQYYIFESVWSITLPVYGILFIYVISSFGFGVEPWCSGSFEGRLVPPRNIFKECKPFVQAPGAVPKESYPVGYPNQWSLKNHTRLHPARGPKWCLQNWNTQVWLVDILPYDFLHMYCNSPWLLGNLPTTCFYKTIGAIPGNIEGSLGIP